MILSQMHNIASNKGRTFISVRKYLMFYPKSCFACTWNVMQDSTSFRDIMFAPAKSDKIVVKTHLINFARLSTFKTLKLCRFFSIRRIIYR